MSQTKAPTAKELSALQIRTQHAVEFWVGRDSDEESVATLAHLERDPVRLSQEMGPLRYELELETRGKRAGRPDAQKTGV